MTMRALYTLAEVEIADDGAPISELRVAPCAKPALRPSILPLPITLVLTELLLGACYADGTFCAKEQAALRALLARLLQVTELPPEIEDRIRTFDPHTFDARAAARTFVETTKAGNRPLLEVICEICTADARLELDENEYMLALVVALEMAKEDYKGLAMKSRLEGLSRLVKRIEDLALGSVALSLLALPMLAIRASVRFCAARRWTSCRSSSTSFAVRCHSSVRARTRPRTTRCIASSSSATCCATK
jgi:hypothetical protein